MVRVRDRPCPFELRMTRGVKNSPIWANATFKYLPRLIDRLDNIVIDAVGLGARSEVAQHDGLIDATRIRILIVVASTRPAELGDHNAFARISFAQFVISHDRLVDRRGVREALPQG